MSTPYHAFVLRIWQEADDPLADSLWRYSLEDVHTGVRRGFADLTALHTFLAQLAARADWLSPEQPDPTRSSS